MMEIENKTVHTPREKGKKISTQPAGRRLIKKKTLGWEGICRTAADTVKPWAGRFFLFPALILYLELVLHFYMGMEMRYFQLGGRVPLFRPDSGSSPTGGRRDNPGGGGAGYLALRRGTGC